MSGVWFSLSAAVLWGLSYALDEKVMTDFTARQMLLLHYVFGAVVSLAWVPMGDIVSRAKEMSENHALLLLTSLSVTYLAGLLILTSISKVGATTAAVIEVSYPFWTALAGFLLFRQAMTLHQILGGGLIMLGVWVASKSA